MVNNQDSFPLKWIALIGLSLLSFTAFLDFTIVVTALPFIQKDLNAPILNLQWVTNIFAMALCMFMIAAGKFGDIFGRRRVFYIGFIFFGIAAFGAGAATNINWLIFFRGLQGIASAIVATNSVALLPQAFPANEQTKALSILSTFNSVGLAIGPFFGGMLITLLSWRWVFWINLPIIFVGLILSFIALRSDTPQPAKSKIDWYGLILLILGLGGIVYGVISGEQNGWDTLITWIPLIVGLISAVLLIIVESEIKDPLLDLSIFTHKNSAVVVCLSFAAGFPAYVLIFFDPLYLHIIRDYSAFWIGIVLITMPIAQVLLAMFFESIEKKIPVGDLLLFGIVSALLASILHIFFNATLPIFVVIIALILMGYTWGISNIGSLTVITRTVKPQKVGSAVGTVYTLINIVGSIALAISTVIFHWREKIYMQRDLQAKGMHLNFEEYNYVHQALVNPDNAIEALRHLPKVDVNSALMSFQHSFIAGYQWVAGFAAIVILFLLLAARQFR